MIQLLLLEVFYERLVFDLLNPVHIALDESEQQPTASDQVWFFGHSLQGFQEHEQRMITGNIAGHSVLNSIVPRAIRGSRGPMMYDVEISYRGGAPA